MKVLYDHQIFTWQDYGGISRYFCELMSQFATDPGVGFHLALRYSQNDHLHQQPQLNRFWTRRNNFFSDSHFFARIQRGIHINALNHVISNRQESIQQLSKQDFDIFHPTYFDPYFLKYLKTKPYVLTVYDMIIELFPDMFVGDTTVAQKKNVIECATKIIAISENTRTDIIRFYDIDPKKIEVIPLATSLQTTTPDSALALPQKYILFVGNRETYKNFTFFINSISALLREENGLSLICAGGGIFSAGEIHLFDDLGIKPKVHYYPIINDSTLSHLYRNAVLFVFPSLYEGFGIPVLEAFSCGCPVAASNCSSLPEVGGDAVDYFNPVNSDSIQQVIGAIVNNDSLQDSLRKRGFQRLKHFSWEKTASATKNVYDNLSSR
jgi:glycosyltransferase involved in cell wall biosynthesis